MPGRVLHALARDGSDLACSPLAHLAELLRDGPTLAEHIECEMMAGVTLKYWFRDGSRGRRPANPGRIAPLIRDLCGRTPPALIEAAALDFALAELAAGRAVVSDDLSSIVAL